MKKFIILMLLLPILTFAADDLLNEVNERDLFVYAARSNVDLIQNWLNNGHSVNIKDPRGNTPLLIAAECGNTDVAQLLVQNGIGVNEANKFGYTPLFAATVNGYPDMMLFLLTNGADPALKNAYGSSVNDFISAKNFDNIDDYIASLNIKDAKIGPNANFYLPLWLRSVTASSRAGDNAAVLTTLNKAASSDPYAQYMLGAYYMKNANTGQGLPYLELAADKGEPNARFQISKYYIDSNDSAYQADGFKYIKAAVDNNYTPAYIEAGKCYLYGIGTDIDYLAAYGYFTKAAELGNVDAEFFIGMQYFYGLGMDQNQEKGMEIITSTAERGSVEAQRQMNRFATEDTLAYFESFDSQSRPMVKTHMLSAGAVLLRSDNDCDSYDTRPFIDEDYGVYRISACFFVDNSKKLTFNMRSNMKQEYKALMENYAKRAPVVYASE